MYEQTVDVAKADAGVETGSTKTYELETAGILSYIDLLAAYTADASAADMVKWIPDWITNIEVIGNSTDILLSLDARELAALVFSMTKKPVVERRTGEQDAVNYLHIPIPFGRVLSDPKYALDLSKWDLVELNITNDDSSGNFFDLVAYTIREKFLRELPSPPVGYFKTYEANSWTPPSAVSEKTVDFPKDHPIRQAMISVLPTYPAIDAALTSEIWEVLDNIKLTYKSGNIVLFDEDTEELMRQNADLFGLVDMGGVVQAEDDDYISTDLGWVLDANATLASLVGGTTTQYALSLSNLPESRLKIDESALLADHPINWKARGYAYMDAMFFHFDKDNSMENLLDPKEMETVRLKYTSASVSGKVRTVLQQLRSY